MMLITFKSIILLILLSLVKICGHLDEVKIRGQLRDIREWEEYWLELCAGKRFLTRPLEWEIFLEMANKRFGDPLFQPEVTLKQFIYSVLTYTLNDERNIPGLYTVKLLLQYAPLKISSEHLPFIHSDTFTSSVSSPSVNLQVTLNPVEWKPVSHKAALDSILICRNLGLKCPDYGINPLYTDAMHKENIFSMFSNCEAKYIGRETLTLKTLANFLGDGAIDREVDLDGNELEGHSTSETACVLAKLFERLLSKREIVEKAGLNGKTILNDIKLLQQAAASHALLRECANRENPQEAFETVILEQLRRLPAKSQILLATGFTKHAMAIRIKRIDRLHYELHIFNSGDGLKHHMSKVVGSKRKVIPAKRYSNLTLMNLKWSQALQRIYQVSAMGSMIIKNPETNSVTNTTAEHFYDIALAGLVNFEQQFTLEEMNHLFRFFTAQNSGTCSVEVLMAFLAFDVLRPYNTLKLLAYKELVDDAFKINWNKKEQPVFNRIMKYGIENHARATLRLVQKKQAKPPSLLLKDLLPDDLWKKYELVKDEYIISKPTQFKAKVEGLKPSVEFHQKYLEEVLEIDKSYFKAKQAGTLVLFSPGKKCDVAALVIFSDNPFTITSFDNYLDHLIYYMSECRLQPSPYETMMFLAMTVIDRWPGPDGELWKNLLGPKNPHHENSLNTLWRFTQKLLKAQSDSEKSNIYLFTSLHKIMMIYRYALSESLPQIFKDPDHYLDNSCADADPFYSGNAAYQCLSGVIFDYFREFGIKKNSCDVNVIQNTLKELAKKYQHFYEDFPDYLRHDVVIRIRKTPEIPAALYYWHVCKNIIITLNSTRENGWKGRYLPILCDPSYHPFNDGFNFRDKGTSEYSSSSEKEPPSELLVLMERIKTNKFSHLNAEERLFFTILNGSHDRVGKFSHILHVSPESFTWKSALPLGAVAAQTPLALDTLVEAISTIDQLINQLAVEFNNLMPKLKEPTIDNPELKQNCELYSGLIVLESILTARSNVLSHSRKHLSDLMFFLKKAHLHSSYKALFVFTYLASLPRDMTEEEIENAILFYRSYQSGLKNKLPQLSVLDQYNDHIQANIIRAFYNLSQKKFQERIKKFVSKEYGEILDVGYISTTQMTTLNNVFDLISGSEIINGSPTSEINREDLNQFYAMANIKEELEKLNFISIKNQFLGQFQLVTCRVEKGNRTLKRENQLYDLAKIEILINKATAFISESYDVLVNGSPKYEVRAIRLPHNFIPVEQVPIPAIIDEEAPYKIFVFPDSNDIAFSLGTEIVWVDANAHLSFQDHQLKDIQYLHFISDEFASPLASRKEVFVYKAKDGSHRLLFRNYADANGMPLWFFSSEGTWKLLSDHKLHLSPNQDFSSSGMLPKYLLLSGEANVHKVLIPIENYKLSENPSNGLYWDTLYKHIRKHCLNISLVKVPRSYDEQEYLQKFIAANQKEGYKKPDVLPLFPHPKSRLESLHLLYNYLVTRNYHEAMKEADKIHQMEPFDGEEFRLLGWIAQSHLATKNGSPASIAIRSFTCFHVFNNDMLFHSLGLKTEISKADKIPNPYSSAAHWKLFWTVKHLETAGESLELYVTRLTKIPLFLRFDPDARFSRVSSIHWTNWISEVLGKSSASRLELYLNPKPETISSPSYRFAGLQKEFANVEDLAEILASNQYQNSFTNISKWSFVEPSILLNGKNQFLAAVLVGSVDVDLSEKMFQWIIPYENIAEFSLIARILKNALSLPRNGMAYYIKYSCEFFPEEKDKDLQKDNCSLVLEKLLELLKQDDCSPLNEEKLNIYLGEPSEMRKNMIEEDIVALTTKSIEDNIFGAPLPIKKIKRLLAANDLLNVGKEIEKTCSNQSYRFDDVLNASDLYRKLKLLQQIMQLYKWKLFTDFVSRGYPKYDCNGDDDTIAKGLETMAYGKLTVTAFDIIHMYAKAQSKYYRQYFPYFDGDVNELHDIATQFVLAHSNVQEIKRLRHAYIKKEANPKSFKLEIIDRIRSTDTIMNNILAYECYINSRLTKKQTDDITTLTTKTEDGKYPDLMVQWIMSAGKTYIMGTLLSVMKADYKHLSILVVPKSLVTGEASNLFSRTISAFNRDGFSFQLKRDPKFADLKTISWIKEAISNAIKRGQYLIMTSEMLESLHDKFVELGKDPGSQREYNEMRDLLRLVKVHGAMTVDEAHKIFDPTKETNFPVAATKANTSDDDTNTLKLETVVLVNIFGILVDKELIRKLGGKEIIKNIPIDLNRESRFLTDTIGDYIVDHINDILQLSNGDQTALKSISRKDLLMFLTEDAKYLNTSCLDNIKTKVSLNLYRALAVCRMAVTSFIPLAWSGNVNENYGLEPGKKYAIPFSGAFAPKIGSEFAFRWYCYARTIRTYLVNGFDEVTIKFAMTWLHQLAVKELALKDDNQNARKMLKTLFGINSPFKVQLGSKKQMSEILLKCQTYHRMLNENSLNRLYVEFLLRWMAQDVIPSIGFYEQQISTNSQDISYMVNSRQLYSGSVVSVRTFPREFLNPRNTRLDKTIDSQIRQAVLNHTLGVAVIPDGLSADDFVNNSMIIDARYQIEQVRQNPLVAVLDVGAYFKDQKNEQVATSLLGIQDYVLYFSTDKNKLALITKEDPSEKLIHTYSADIIKELVPDESQRITFYDQQHNTGVDIFQHVDGAALIIIGAKTTSIDFYQSVMRMRKFLESQSLYIIVPQHVAKVIGKDSPSVEDILVFMEDNLKDSIVDLNAKALSQMIGAIFKEAAYEKLLNDEIDKEVLDIWIKDTSSDIHNLVIPQRTRDYTRHVVPNIITTYLSKVQKYFSKKDLDELHALANDVVSRAFGHQPDQQYPRHMLCSVRSAEGDVINEDDDSFKISENSDSDMHAIATVTVENEINLKMEIENEQVEFLPFKDSGYFEWTQATIPWIKTENGLNFKSLETSSGGVIRINEVLYTGSNKHMAPKVFSDSLLMTSGFAIRAALFGHGRGFIPHCLVLIGKDHDFFIFLNENDAGNVYTSQLSKSGANTVFGYPAALVDPVRHVVDTGLNQNIDKEKLLQRIEPLLWQAIYFAGYMKILARPESKSHILNFLFLPAVPENPNPNNLFSDRYQSIFDVDKSSKHLASFKSALLTDVIISNTERAKYAKGFPGKKSLIEYMGIASEKYQECQKSNYLALHFFFSRSRSHLSSYIAHIQKDAIIYDLEIIIQNHENFQILTGEELLGAVKGTLKNFFSDPQLSMRNDIGKNIAAIIDFQYNFPRLIIPIVATGAIQVLNQIDIYPSVMIYKDVFSIVGRYIRLFYQEPMPQWIQDYSLAVDQLGYREEYRELFDSLVPQNFLDFKDSKNQRVLELFFKTVSIPDPRPGVMGMVMNLLRMDIQRLPTNLENAIYKSIDLYQFVKFNDNEPLSKALMRPMDNPLSLIDGEAEKIFGMTFTDKPWFDLQRYATVHYFPPKMLGLESPNDETKAKQ